MPERPYRMRELHDHYARSRAACRERDGLDQSTPAGLLPSQRLCTRCGRVTARRDAGGLPCCGGDPLTLAQYAAERTQPGGETRVSRRTVATLRRPDPHDYERDPDTPGYCLRCHLIKANMLHDPELVAAWKRDQDYHAAQAAAAQEQHRRRTGES